MSNRRRILIGGILLPLLLFLYLVRKNDSIRTTFFKTAPIEWKDERWMPRNQAYPQTCQQTVRKNDSIRTTFFKTAPIEWKDERWMPRNQAYPQTCQQTAIFPFEIGCPTKCQRARGHSKETRYQMSLNWSFGQPKHFDHLPTYYNKGKNYECPQTLIDNFIYASDTIAAQASARFPTIRVKRQKRLHMSLMYMCCLFQNETDHAREIYYDWVVENRPFDFTARFNKLECWKERTNSVTNIIVADETTQVTMMGLYRNLHERFEREGIPVEVPRTDQMPFHITLLGLHLGDGSGNGTPEDDIDPYLGDIYSIVAPVSSRMGDQWAGPGRMHITHDPRPPVKAAAHTNLKIRKK